MGKRHKWKPHCLCEIHGKRTDQRRFISSAVLPWLIDEVVTANKAAVLYLWKHLYEVHGYPPQRVVSIDVGEVERLVWYLVNNGTRSAPEDYAPARGKVC